jgi:Uma2 family endonuclease
MEAIAVQKKTEILKNVIVQPLPRVQRRMKYSEFEKRYSGKEDGYKYEWVHGIVEKSSYTMNPRQLFIQRNLTALFRKLLNLNQVFGELLAEPDLFFETEVLRRPDLAWLTNQQIDRLSIEGNIEIPAFVIEVISTNDASQRLVSKMRQYRTSGVQIVWHIFPFQQEVHVYGGTNLETMNVCFGEKICSADPVLPNFAFPASAIFQIMEAK